MKCLVSNIPYRVQQVFGDVVPTPLQEDTELGAKGSSAYAAYELARLQGLLRALGHEVLAVDISSSHRDQIVALVEDFLPDVVIVDATSYQDHTERHLLLQFFLLVKTVRPATRTIWGGRDAAQLFDFALTHSTVVDVVLCDESDSTLPPLLRRWDECGFSVELEDLPGLAYRNGFTIRRTAEARSNELVELDTLPFLDYRGIRLANDEWPLVMSSRGCPFSCRFCYRQYRTHRAHSVSYFVSHLHHLMNEYGYHRFRFDDELFTLDRARCRAICEEMARRRLQIEFDCYSRINTFDEELAKALNRAGCRMVWFGLESGSDELLARMGKGQTRRDIVESAAAAKRGGLEVCCNVLVGYPGETSKTILDTILLLAEIRPDRVSVQRLRIMPGTELFRWSEDRGMLDPEAWIVKERDFCYERDFSREGLDVLVRYMQQLNGDAATELNEDLAKYLILKGSRPVCLCRAVGEEELRFAVQSGATSIRALQKQTGATGGCGGCTKIVATLLEVWKEEKENPVPR